MRNLCELDLEIDMSKSCPSRLSKYISWVMKAPLINIPLFIMGMLVFWQLLSQQDRYYLFIPLGSYAKYIEYILLLVIFYFIFLAYKRRNDKVDECNFLIYYIAKVPILKTILDSFIIIFIAYGAYYILLLYMHKFNIPIQDTKVEVKILDISNRGRKSCKPLMETDFLKKYNPENQTLFYKFIKKYSFDDICLHKKYFDEGQTVILDIKESPFGMYITGIQAKVY